MWLTERVSRVLVSTDITLSVLYNAGNFLTCWATASFSAVLVIMSVPGHIDVSPWRFKEPRTEARVDGLVNSKWFWLGCITLKITGFLDFLNRPVF
jgi:hypothetical protein